MISLGWKIKYERYKERGVEVEYFIGWHFFPSLVRILNLKNVFECVLQRFSIFVIFFCFNIRIYFYKNLLVNLTFRFSTQFLKKFVCFFSTLDYLFILWGSIFSNVLWFLNSEFLNKLLYILFHFLLDFDLIHTFVFIEYFKYFWKLFLMLKNHNFFLNNLSDL